MLSLKFYLNKDDLIELCQNVARYSFLVADRQVATVAMKTTQLVLS